ncbi:MAG: hypothetical protein V3W41_18795 [Planctomycetota bacterium]
MSQARQEDERRIVIHQLLRRRGIDGDQRMVLELDEVASYLTRALYPAEELRVESVALTNAQDRRRIRRLQRAFEGRVAPVVRTRAGTTRAMDSKVHQFFRRYSAALVALLVFAAAILIPFSFSHWFGGEDRVLIERVLVVSRTGSPVFVDPEASKEINRSAQAGSWLARGTQLSLDRGDRLSLLFRDGSLRNFDEDGESDLRLADENLSRLYRLAEQLAKPVDLDGGAGAGANRDAVFIRSPLGLTYSTRPRITWAAPRGMKNFELILLKENGEVLFRRQVPSRSFNFPPSELDLQPGATYIIRLMPKVDHGRLAEASILSISAVERAQIEDRIKKVSKLPGGPLMQALTLAEAGLLSEAADLFERQREYDANNVGILRMLEACYYRLGLKELARRTRELADKRSG